MAEKKILKYNFKRPDRISKNQIRSLHFVHDRFARNFSSSISAYLRTVVEITLENIAQIHLAIPTLVLEPIIHIFDQEEYSRRKIVQDGTLLHLLRNIPVEVSIGTAETSFPMEALLSLQVGDTLVLDQREQWPVIIKVGGKDKLHAKAQMDSTRKAFGITGHIRPRREEPTNGYVAE